jgi:hypothetical protein
MALEDAIVALTKAVEANTAALTGGKAPAKASGSTSSKPAASGKKTTTSKKKAEITVDEVAEAFGKYLKAEKANGARDNIQKISAHFGADRVTEIEPEHFAEAMELLKQYEAGEDPLGDGDDDDDDDDDDGAI